MTNPNDYFRLSHVRIFCYGSESISMCIVPTLDHTHTSPYLFFNCNYIILLHDAAEY
jgi:hypothetical protein